MCTTMWHCVSIQLLGIRAVLVESGKCLHAKKKQALMLWEVALTMGVLISTNISIWSSASRSWSFSVCLTLVGMFCLTHTYLIYSIIMTTPRSKHVAWMLTESEYIICSFIELPASVVIVFHCSPTLISCSKDLQRTTTSLLLCRG